VIASVSDKYKVLEKLGEGATATVYRGQHLAIGKDVAIKVLHPHLSASSRYRERFNREARAVGRLSHENIVSILDYSGQNAADCYIVTELVVGATLLQLIEEHGRLPSEMIVLLAIELSNALAFAHRAGIIHRDVKPENVMVRRDGVVKLMDFGVARISDEGQITLDGSLLGSPAYMSPQQAVDEKLAEFVQHHQFENPRWRSARQSASRVSSLVECPREKSHDRPRCAVALHDHNRLVDDAIPCRQTRRRSRLPMAFPRSMK